MTKERKLLQRVKPGQYEDEKGVTWFIKEVTRDYAGRKKKPVYFLQKLQGNKLKYISGLFTTKEENIFSFDIKDSFGIKKIYKLKMINAGDEIEIIKG